MTKKTERFLNDNVDSNSLQLDNDNIRFFHIKDHSPEESLLIVEKKSIQDLVNKMVKDGFDPIYPLHISKERVVRDGNRRLLSYRIATGYTQYKEISAKYGILNFGGLGKVEKIPIKQYANDEDLSRYVRSQHLVNEQVGWTSSAKYTYLYNLFINNEAFDYPNDILSIAKSVELFLRAIDLALGKEKSGFEKAYEDKVSVLYRMFGNIKLLFNGEKQSLAKLMGFDFNEQHGFEYNKLIDEVSFGKILFEVTKYVVGNSVGATIKDVTDFPETNKILKNLFKIKSIKPETKLTKSTPIIHANAITQTSAAGISGEINTAATVALSSKFYLEENVSVSFIELKISQKDTKTWGWRERVLIENSLWYLSARSLKKLGNHSNFDFLSDLKNIDKFDGQFRQIFKKLNSHQNNISDDTKLAGLIQEFGKCFSSETKDNSGNEIFCKEEKAFVNWIKSSSNNYLINLNYASHGRWDNYDTDLLSKELNSIINRLIQYWQTKW